MIKFDLHIHSVCSKYKETERIVDDSTIENIETLLDKLEEHNVQMFSITDHNRFYPELYVKITKILGCKDCKYNNIKTILAGVEFDVKMDSEMDKCHIITIFDCKKLPSDFYKIKNEIEKKKLTNKDAKYNRNDFEDLLNKINLNTILIACQRKDINNHNGKHNSLSDSTSDVLEIIKIGYINAFEYQKPKVEGILINNLKSIPKQIGLVTGSDCHTWSAYPYHDSVNQNKEFYHSKANILPTFKGLLMGITSPETRFNCNPNNNPDFLKGIKVNEKIIPLVNGINAIIGENGSGKSTILKFLNDKLSQQYENHLIDNNDLKMINYLDSTKIKYIGQGDIINRFNSNTLFSSSGECNFQDIDNTDFIDEYNQFSKSLEKRIIRNIESCEASDLLEKREIEYNSDLNEKTYFINITYQKDFDKIINEHKSPLQKVGKIIDSLKKLNSIDYFNKYQNKLKDVINTLNFIYTEISSINNKIEIESALKNIILSCITDYELEIKGNSSSRDREELEYSRKRQSVIDSVVNAVRFSNIKSSEIKEPEIFEGISRNARQGFYFNKEAEYNNKSMLNSFFSHMFNRQIDSLKKAIGIDTYGKYVAAIRNCTSKADIKTKWEENLNKFLSKSIKDKEYITDGTNSQIGNTLGEMSLSFFKYYTKSCNDWNSIVMDQPEDNISNLKISSRLVKFFNSIRDSKQLVIATHNPLLVVNLDVDNVVYVKNINGNLTFESGCLEFEDNDTNILKIIADNMDGGTESIKKRLKVYGK